MHFFIPSFFSLWALVVLLSSECVADEDELELGYWLLGEEPAGGVDCCIDCAAATLPAANRIKANAPDGRFTGLSSSDR